MAIGEELAAAVGCLTVLERPAAGASRAALAGGLAWYPVIGLVLGAVAAGVAVATETVLPAAAGPAGVLALVALSGARGVRGLGAATEALRRGDAGRLRPVVGALGIAAAATAVLVRAVAASVLPAPARTTALLLAPMLGAWAVVVGCYGGAPIHASGIAAALVGRARFREFAWASVTALGTTLAIGEPIGLVVVLAASLATVGARVGAYRRLGGLTEELLAASRELVETVVLVTLGVLAQLRT
jgi:adenosylcobinamide-GDP ribazoletransferase